MNKTSKRDIYDLIAELAKSSNMDIDGTEFVPENVDVRRKPSANDLNVIQLINSTPPEPEHLIHLEPAPTTNNQPQDETKLLDDLKLAQSNSIEELNLLKAAAIEELKQAKAAMIRELHVNSNGKLLSNDIHDKSEDLNTTIQQSSIFEEIDSTSIVTPLETNSNNQTSNDIANELQPLKVLELNTQDEVHVENTVDFFEDLDIDELNRITSDAIKTEEPIQSEPILEQPISEVASIEATNDSNIIATQVLEDQLRSINDKLDSISQGHLKSEIVNELKLSDERIVQQVNKSRETLLNDLGSKLNNFKPASVDSFIRWLGIVNLMLLLIVLVYLLFQKGNVVSTSNTNPTEQIQPQLQPQQDSANTKEEQPQATQPSLTESPTESTNNKSDFQTEATKTITSTSHAMRVKSTITNNKKENSESKSNKPENSTEPVAVNPQPSSMKPNLDIQKNASKNMTAVNTLPSKNKQSVSKPNAESIKKNTSSQDVYFGED